MKPWLKGLAAAVLGGIANAGPLVIVDPLDFNPFDPAGLVKLGKVCVTSALLAVFLYLRQPPKELSE